MLLMAKHLLYNLPKSKKPNFLFGLFYSFRSFIHVKYALLSWQEKFMLVKNYGLCLIICLW